MSSVILMIDDSADDASLIKRVVKKHSGELKFQWISDPVEALEFLQTAKAEDYLLILLDIKMPKMTGLELLESLEEAGSLSTLARKIIVYSSSDLSVDQDQAATYAEIRYKTKPSGYLDAKLWLGELINEHLTYPAK